MSPMAPGEADWGNFGKSFAQLAETNAASNPIGPWVFEKTEFETI